MESTPEDINDPQIEDTNENEEIKQGENEPKISKREMKRRLKSEKWLVSFWCINHVSSTNKWTRSH